MKRVKTAVAGCGSVSQPYLTDLTKCDCAEVAAVVDISPERAEARAREFGVAHYYGDMGAMLEDAGIELVVNLTSMQSHHDVNRKALLAGKHVLSEKPMASTRSQGKELLAMAKERNLQIYAAPNVATSPAFRHVAEIVNSGRIGKVFQAFGCYGHGGSTWGPWFYAKGGGALFDLGVYNVTFLTGILGPAKAVTALSGTAIRDRLVDGQWIQAESDDNTMLLMDHGNSVFSTVACGFVSGRRREESTVELIGTKGSVNLLGWDWQPNGVEVWTNDSEEPVVECRDQSDYHWSTSGSLVARCLATGESILMNSAHAYHVLDVMISAHESADRGCRIVVESEFAKLV